MDQARCRGLDPELFFFERNESAHTYQALDVCNVCPVRLQCFDYGVNEKFGVFGGSSDRKRRTFRSKVRSTRREFEECVMPVVEELSVVIDIREERLAS